MGLGKKSKKLILFLSILGALGTIRYFNKQNDAEFYEIEKARRIVKESKREENQSYELINLNNTLYKFKYDKVLEDEIIKNIFNNYNRVCEDYLLGHKKLEKYENLFKKIKPSWKRNLLKAIAIVESGVNEKAISKKGYKGMFQLGDRLMKHYGYKPEDAFIPEIALEVANKEISRLLKKYNSKALALIAYNWGEGNLDKVIKKYGKDWNKIKDHVPKPVRAFAIIVLTRDALHYFPIWSDYTYK